MIEKRGQINKCGIYKISNKYGVVKYIGGAIECNDAYSRHSSNLINGKYAETNKHELQVLFNTEELYFSILKECTESELNKEETKYIKMYRSTIVNSDNTGKRRTTKSTTEETEKRRQANTGEKNPHNTVLNFQQSCEILWLKNNTKMKQKDIALMYGISPNLVSRVGKDRWMQSLELQPSFYESEVI